MVLSVYIYICIYVDIYIYMHICRCTSVMYIYIYIYVYGICCNHNFLPFHLIRGDHCPPEGHLLQAQQDLERVGIIVLSWSLKFRIIIFSQTSKSFAIYAPYSFLYPHIVWTWHLVFRHSVTVIVLTNWSRNSPKYIHQLSDTFAFLWATISPVPRISDDIFRSVSFDICEDNLSKHDPFIQAQPKGFGHSKKLKTRTCCHFQQRSQIFWPGCSQTSSGGRGNQREPRPTSVTQQMVHKSLDSTWNRVPIGDRCQCQKTIT